MLTVSLDQLVRTFLPEPSCGCKTWLDHSRHLWTEDRIYMASLTRTMQQIGWFGSVLVNDGYVQDAHHRICVALSLGLFGCEITIIKV